MPAVAANKPRDEVTHLPTPRVSLSIAGKICSVKLVAKMPVILIIHDEYSLLGLVYHDKLERITVALLGRNGIGAPARMHPAWFHD